MCGVPCGDNLAPMLELIQITNDPAFAAECDALPAMRLFVDLEQHGKHERQAGRNTFISSHTVEDVGRVRRAARRSRVMVRLNPLHHGTAAEVDAVLAQGLRTGPWPVADCLMLPMFTRAQQLTDFCRIVAGRVPVVALVETVDAVRCMPDWVETPGLGEVFVGLNDLHLTMGCSFMFEPLADGTVEAVARQAQAQGLSFGFGGIARLDEGLLPGSDVLAEHERLGSGSVILSRTFHRSDSPAPFEVDVAALRALEARLALRRPLQRENDRLRVAERIEAIAADMARQRINALPTAKP